MTETRRNETWALFKCPHCGYCRQYAIGRKRSTGYFPYWYPWCPKKHYAPVTSAGPLPLGFRLPRLYVGMNRVLVMERLTREERAQAVAGF